MYDDITTLTRTRLSWHTLAEHVVSPARYAAAGRIGLELSRRGYATPWYSVDGSDRRVLVEDEYLSIESKTSAGVSTRGRKVTTLRECAEFVGITAGAPAAVYTASTELQLDAPLPVDAEAAHALSEWWEITAAALQQLLVSAGSDAGLTLWPEHFDLATSFDAVNYGASPGDDWSAEPYVYVGPHSGPGADIFWNAPFGAARTWREISSTEDALAFIEQGRALAHS